MIFLFYGLCEYKFSIIILPRIGKHCNRGVHKEKENEYYQMANYKIFRKN